MKIWITRHGQTRLNHDRLMQGLSDEPLNETGIAQAKAARELVKDVLFDAVYASPLQRAVVTGSIIGGVPAESVITDPRIIEADFGRYEQRSYYLLGPSMTLYWAVPEIFRAPATVETIASMIARSSAFLRELESKDYENVLVSCHGGIMRVMTGYLTDAPRGYVWRPKARNCEIRVFESEGGRHRMLRKITIS